MGEMLWGDQETEPPSPACWPGVQTGKGLQREHTPDKMYFLQGKMIEMVQAFQNPGFLKRETG